MEVKDKKELLDNLTKTKSSFATNISKGHSVMPKADGKQLIVGKKGKGKNSNSNRLFANS